MLHKLLPIMLGLCLVSAATWAQEVTGEIDASEDTRELDASEDTRELDVSEDTRELDASEITKALSNPNATMGFMLFNLDYVSFDGDLPGASSESALKLTFQPSLPYPLSDSVNFFVRPSIPLFLDQPVPVVGDQFDSRGVELGDISFDMAVGKSFPNKNVLFGGIVGTLPTATDDDLGLDQWLLGPEVYFGRNFGFGHIGLLLTHQWDIAGEDDFDTSITGGQYFFTYNLKKAWQIQMQPTFSYNHNATSGNKLTLPIGIGVSKMTILGGKPWRFALQYWHYVESPDRFGPDFQVRFQAMPVVALPW